MLLYGAISSLDSWWQDVVTPKKFNEELAALGDVSEIVVRINSGGGDVFAANAIFTRLKDHSAKITVKVDGWAASAATIIAMAGDTIKIAKNGVFMIHDPSMTVWDSFTAEEFEKMADELKVIKQSIVNTYAMKTGLDENDIADMMANETWWTGEDAVKNGFCDEIMFSDAKTEVENASRIIVNNVPLNISEYKTLPKLLLNSPINPGGFSNSATNKNAKEDKGMEQNSTITTVDALKTAYPDLVKQIEDAAAKTAAESAAKNERERIKAVHDLTLDGYEDIAQDAMFENPATAEQVAVKIIAAQKAQGNKYLTDRAADVENDHVNEVGAGTQTQTGANGESEYDAAIDALFPDAQ